MQKNIFDQQEFPLTLMMSKDSFLNDKNKPIGRRSAGSSFLDAYLQYGGNDLHSIVVTAPGVSDWFHERALAFNPKSSTKPIGVRNWGFAAQKTGSFHIPDPRIERWAWRRMLYGDGTISLVGIMHTLSSNDIQKALSEFSSAPIRPWDSYLYIKSW